MIFGEKKFVVFVVVDCHGTPNIKRTVSANFQKKINFEGPGDVL